VLHELEARGDACVPEGERAIIREQVQSPGDALQWTNTSRYTRLMLERPIASVLAKIVEVYKEMFYSPSSCPRQRS
jgi:predicted ATPase